MCVPSLSVTYSYIAEVACSCFITVGEIRYEICYVLVCGSTTSSQSHPVDPFYWAWLPMAKIPFSDGIAFLVLDKLKDEDFIQRLVDDLLKLFRVSPKMHLLHCYTCLNNSVCFHFCFSSERQRIRSLNV